MSSLCSMPPRSNGLGMASPSHWPVARPIRGVRTAMSATLTSGPPSAVHRWAFGRSGGEHDARPPSGQRRISSALPPTARQAMQWPNSCRSTTRKSAARPMAVGISPDDASEPTLADLASMARMNARKKRWTRTVIRATRNSGKAHDIGSSKLGLLPRQSPLNPAGRPRSGVSSHALIETLPTGGPCPADAKAGRRRASCHPRRPRWPSRARTRPAPSAPPRSPRPARAAAGPA